MAKKIVRPVWVPKFAFKAWIKVTNWMADIKISRWAKKNDIHRGTRQILLGGVWVDKDNNLYNCLGKRIGKAEWAKGYENTIKGS